MCWEICCCIRKKNKKTKQRKTELLITKKILAQFFTFLEIAIPEKKRKLKVGKEA